MLGSLSAVFDFGGTKGFLGPSENPSDQGGFTNTDKTLIAVNHQPVTKSSYAHLFLRSPAGDLTLLNNVNGRVPGSLRSRGPRVQSISFESNVSLDETLPST